MSKPKIQSEEVDDMDCIMVTNNYRCLDKWQGKFQIDYKETWKYLDVLLAARDYVHQGYHLLTHPLAGSVKPNQTPFKSIILSKESLEGAQEFRDLVLIEESITSYHKFMNNRPLPDWSEQTAEDFRTIDLSFMEGAVANPIISNR